jgi:hypothetical protein
MASFGRNACRANMRTSKRWARGTRLPSPPQGWFSSPDARGAENSGSVSAICDTGP